MGRKSVREEEGREHLGIGMMLEDFQEKGKRLEVIERLKMCFRGGAIEEAVALSRKEEILSRPEAVLVGRLEMRKMIVFRA